jgi:CMP-N,N'-diacetyllegionaminic acid synthase
VDTGENILAFIPARGGSKSIPLKNLVRVGGRSLLEYAVRAANACPLISHIVCSTDHEEIASHAENLGVAVDRRLATLSGDEINVLDVLKEYLTRTKIIPEIVVLFQPTSPFLRPADVERVVEVLRNHATAITAQTVTLVPHNYHAWNQRIFENGMVKFASKQERLGAFNKQLKPKLYKFGNVVAVRATAVPVMAEFFEEPSVGVEVETPYDLDVDGPEDVEMAEALLSSGLVHLPHLD